MSHQYPPPPPPGQPIPSGPQPTQYHQQPIPAPMPQPQVVPPQAPPPQQQAPQGQYAQYAPVAPQQPQQQQLPAPMGQTPPYWPKTQTPPQYQQGAPTPQQPIPATPTFNAADEGAMSSALDDAEQRAAARQAGGNFSQYIKIPGPRGETKWDNNIPVGYEGHSDVYLCGGWAPGVLPFIEMVTHFYKSHVRPKGAVVSCSDDDNCMFCEALKLGRNHTDPTIKQTADSWGRRRRQFLYNAVDLTNPQAHYGSDGQMRPFILSASVTMQTALKRMFETRGGINTFANPQSGRPIRLTKKKTGAENMNIEYGCIDLDPAPLDQYFWPALQNLWNLQEESKASTPAEVAAAIMELGLPMPQGAAVAQPLHSVQTQPQAYSPAPQAPHGNPYPQQAAPPAPPQQYAAPPPPPQAPGMPPPPQPQAPMPAPQQGMAPPPPPPPNAGQPPPMAPPPVTSDGSVPPPPPPGPQGPPPNSPF